MDFFFIWLSSVVIGFWIFMKIKEWQNLPPGPWGLPILGYLPFLDRFQPHLTLTELSKKYGPIYGIGMGNIYAVVLSDHKLIREAFAKENFSGRAPLYLTHGIMHGNGIICAEGALWRDQRKLITTWLKSFGMSKHSLSREKLEKRIADGVFELLTNLQENHSSSMDVSQMLMNSLGNIVNEIIFGFKFPSEDKTWLWLRQIQEEGCHEMGVAGVVNFLPFVRFFSSDTRKTIQVLIRGQAQTHRLYASIIARRRKMLGLEKPKGAEYPPHEDIFNDHPKGHIKCIKYSKHTSTTEEHFFDPETLIPTDGECILDNFLYEQKRRFEEGDATRWNVRDEQLHYLLADMFGAGLDTTSVTLAWFLLFMALYPDEQELVRTEILSINPDGNDVDGSRLPRLMAAICETQRIRSIVPVGIPHGCLQTIKVAQSHTSVLLILKIHRKRVEEYKAASPANVLVYTLKTKHCDTFIGSYRIPKGAMVIPLQWALHMDPDVWEDPEDFKPSRFLDIDGSLLKPQEFIPFQTGKRMCPGDELSRMLSYGVVVRLLRRWRIRFASDTPSAADIRGIVGVTLAPPRVMYSCEPV